MQLNKNLALAAIAVLVIVTLSALMREGLSGMLTPFKASFWTWQIFIDLVLALVLVMIWIWRDCKRRGKTPVPWIVATIFTGSFAPLVYLYLRNKDN